MKVTLNWLKDYVDFDLSTDDLSHRLTMAGLEVDAMEHLGEGLDSVIVARLADVQQHPEADRLTICTVETGSLTQQVVCGAKNHKTGDHRYDDIYVCGCNRSGSKRSGVSMYPYS